MKPYRADLATIHDEGYCALAEAAADLVSERLAAAGVDSGLVVDLGCGSGALARRVVDAGHDVLGVDLSPDMIRLAKQRVPEARFRVGSFLDTRLPSCSAVTATGEVLNYLFDPRNRLTSLRKLFRRVRSALEPGGLFVFDVAGPERRTRPGRSFQEGPDWTCLVEWDVDRERQILTRRIVTYRKKGRNFARDEETHVQQLYRATDLAAELRELGFLARVLRGYGDFRFPRGLAGVLARKP